MASGSSGSAKREVDVLIEHQRRSAAVETLLTIALLLFSSSQLLLNINYSNPALWQKLFVIATPLVTISSIILALAIGGKNLLYVLRSEISRTN
jgi:hypothetical protein